MAYSASNFGFYYTYASYRTRERAEEELENMFAWGEVSEGERPLIVYDRDRELFDIRLRDG